MREISIDDLQKTIPSLTAGQRFALTGDANILFPVDCEYLKMLLKKGEPLPFETKGAVIVLAVVTTDEEKNVVSCAAWPSLIAEDVCMELISQGAAAIVGTGVKSKRFHETLCENGTVYLCMTGGAGAIMAEYIK